MITVELKPLALLLERVATEMGWCTDAEKFFLKATGVKFMPYASNCELDDCPGSSCIKPETRFILPDASPHSVPEGRIIRVLREQADVARCPGCDCGGDEDLLAALQRLANALPSRPDLSKP